jgi:hypothetical protein
MSRRLALISRCCMAAAAFFCVSLASAQQPAFGPTATVAQPAAGAWPSRPPSRIYVVPFVIDPVVQQRAEQQGPVIPQGPVRQLIASRPRVTDMVMGHDRSIPAGTAIAKIVADELAGAGYPVVFWTNAEPPPADGWRLGGQVVALDVGNAVAHNAIGFGAGNAEIGIDVAMSDPMTANGQPFFVINTSDRGRLTPGTAPVAAVAGFNPVVIAGKVVASNSGLADITQQKRMADEIAVAIAEAINLHARPAAR